MPKVVYQGDSRWCTAIVCELNSVCAIASMHFLYWHWRSLVNMIDHTWWKVAASRCYCSLFWWKEASCALHSQGLVGWYFRGGDGCFKCPEVLLARSMTHKRTTPTQDSIEGTACLEVSLIQNGCNRFTWPSVSLDSLFVHIINQPFLASLSILVVSEGDGVVQECLTVLSRYSNSQTVIITLKHPGSRWHYHAWEWQEF